MDPVSKILNINHLDQLLRENEESPLIMVYVHKNGLASEQYELVSPECLLFVVWCCNWDPQIYNTYVRSVLI